VGIRPLALRHLGLAAKRRTHPLDEGVQYGRIKLGEVRYQDDTTLIQLICLSSDARQRHAIQRVVMAARGRLCTDEGELLGKRLTERIQLGYQGLKGLDYTVHCGIPTWQNGKDQWLAAHESEFIRRDDRESIASSGSQDSADARM
jgi:hypothetical protein